MKKNEKYNLYNLVVYVENSNTKIKSFSTIEKANKFVKNFNKKYPDEEATRTGCWIDFSVYGITGEIVLNPNLGLKIE